MQPASTHADEALQRGIWFTSMACACPAQLLPAAPTPKREVGWVEGPPQGLPEAPAMASGAPHHSGVRRSSRDLSGSADHQPHSNRHVEWMSGAEDRSGGFCRMEARGPAAWVPWVLGRVHGCCSGALQALGCTSRASGPSSSSSSSSSPSSVSHSSSSSTSSTSSSSASSSSPSSSSLPANTSPVK